MGTILFVGAKGCLFGDNVVSLLLAKHKQNAAGITIRAVTKMTVIKRFCGCVMTVSLKFSSDCICIADT